MKRALGLLSGIVMALAMPGCVSSPAATPAAAIEIAPGWVGAWGASPTIPLPGGRSFDNQTIRQVMRLSAGGAEIRVRLTNEYGDKPLKIGAATVALAGPDGKPVGQPLPIHFAGDTSTVIPPGAPLLSDPVRIDVKALDSLSISLFMPEPTGPCMCHFAGTATAFVSLPGNFTTTMFEPKETFTNRAYVSGIEVQVASPATIVPFGDSITDGTASTNNANRRWPDVLAERLAAAGETRGISNQAIAGNRVLSQQSAIFGASALARFDRDVASVPNAKWLVVLEGINDIGMGGATPPSAETLIGGYRQLIARAKSRGMKVYFATLLPYEGARYFHEAGEAVRQQVNTWIRSTQEIDGVIDFDLATRDPANPRKMQANLQSGDWLHPNDAGYKVMGDAVDLALFR
jgi:lysophospholipase L1-like esterase